MCFLWVFGYQGINRPCSTSKDDRYGQHMLIKVHLQQVPSTDTHKKKLWNHLDWPLGKECDLNADIMYKHQLQCHSRTCALRFINIYIYIMCVYFAWDGARRRLGLNIRNLQRDCQVNIFWMVDSNFGQWWKLICGKLIFVGQHE